MKSAIEHLQSRIEEMNGTIQHIAKQRTPDSELRVSFDLEKNRNIKEIERQIRGYRKAIRILNQDIGIQTINED
jgi:prefoldin subunit 5